MTLSEVRNQFGNNFQGFLDLWEAEKIDGHWIEEKVCFQRHEVINLKLDIMKRSNEVVK